MSEFAFTTTYAQSPLHHFKLAKQAHQQDGSCGVWMNELPLLRYIVLRGDIHDPIFTQTIKDTLEISLPTPHTFTSFEQGIVLWQSPDEWLLVCKRTAHKPCFNNLENALNTVHAQVVDNSGGLTMVYVSGKNHIELLHHVGSYDFDSVKEGQAISTICSKVNIVALRHDDDGIFIIFRRSFADYFWRLLTKSARPYGLGISELKSPESHPVLKLL
jgi:sarcosine oxidase subunit gamma